MKKLFAVLSAVILSVCCLFGIAGCNKGNDTTYSVYAPDGAPALSMVGILNSDDADRFEINVVKADTINAYVTGDAPQADFAVMPVNAAVKLLGNGEKYKMLGTVTNGNLFLMKKQGENDIATASDLTKIIGKTVGVINLTNVPGLTFKVILNDNNIEYNELKEGASAALDKVNLINITAQEATPVNANCQYFIVPEPAASTKKAATQGKLDFAGSLQTLYGGNNGYPQAVAVAKASIIKNDNKTVGNFIAMLQRSSEALTSNSADIIVNAVKGWIKGDTAPTFTAENLNATVIANCGVNFKNNSTGKQRVLEYMEKINAISDNAFDTPSDNFFYGDAFGIGI